MHEIGIPAAPTELFKYKVTPFTQVTRQTQSIFFVDSRYGEGTGVVYPPEGGIEVYKVGGDLEETEVPGKYLLKNPVPLLFPEKGFPTPEAVGACNYVKRYLIASIRLLSKPMILAWVGPVMFFSKKTAADFVSEFSSMGMMILKPYIMEEKFYRPLCRQLAPFINKFINGTGINHASGRFGVIISTLIEYDSAYYTRVEDLFNETSKEALLKNPRNEIKKLIAIYKKREPKKHLQQKFESVGRILRFALLIPRIKKAFRMALEDVEFAQMQMDAADRYHVLRLGGYDYLGLPVEARRAIYVNMHNGKPPKPYEISS